MFGIKTAKYLLGNLNKTLVNLATGTENALSTAETVHKTAVTTTGGMGLAKSAVDIAEDLICQDYICLTVDCIGLCADGLTCATSLLPGINGTSMVTIPISASCKFFRWCCTRSLLKIGCKR